MPTSLNNVGAPAASWRRGAGLLVPAALVIGAGLLAWSAWHQYIAVHVFRNPVAYTVAGGRLYVLEKKDNILLELDIPTGNAPLRLIGARSIAPDDGNCYYMVRGLYPAGSAVVAQDYRYDQASRMFCGFRFRLLPGDGAPPRELLTIVLTNAPDNPEVCYAMDAAGAHCFAHNFPGRPSLWRIRPGPAVRVEPDRPLPDTVEELGETNSPLALWRAVAVGPAGEFYLTSGDSGRVLCWGPAGARRREFGVVGFGEDQLMAPVAVTLAGRPPALWVASTGTRAWLRYALTGARLETVAPLARGYPFPDILAGAVYTGAGPDDLISFDLVNRCLVRHGRPFRVVTTYAVRQPGRAAALGGAALLLLGGALLWPRCRRGLGRLRVPFFAKLLVLFVPLLAASLLGTGRRVARLMRADLEAEYVRRSANLARAVINTLPPGDLAAIRQPDDRDSPAYQRVFQLVNRLLDPQRVEGTPRWILHLIRDGRWYYGINNWRSPLFEPFIVPRDRPMFRRALLGRAPQYGRFTDDQGEWFSYVAPVTNRDGRVIFVLELYRATEEMGRAERKATQQVWRIAGGAVPVGAALVLLFAYWFTRPLRRLTLATVRVSRGDFRHPIRVSTRDEVGTLAGAFNRMLAALEQYTADLARATAEKERMASELRYAREIQEGLLPRAFPPDVPPANIEISARLEPAREVGGDFVDFFTTDPEHLGVVVADVCGKGLPAGLFMVQTRTALRDNAMGSQSAAAALTRVNRALAEENVSQTFVTMFYFVCDVRTGKVIYCNAGHNWPLWLSDGRARPLVSPDRSGCNPVCGVLPELVYTESSITLAPGDALLLFTDGVTEAFGPGRAMYGDERLEAFAGRVARDPAAEIVRRLFGDVAAFRQQEEVSDDITVLVFKYLGPPSEPSQSNPRR